MRVFYFFLFYPLELNGFAINKRLAYNKKKKKKKKN